MEAEYKTDRAFSVTGVQTSEASVRYAIKRFAEKGNELAGIVAFTLVRNSRNVRSESKGGEVFP
ncbi:MAG: hypothetical protein LBK69_08225 [Syntrophomonadaceae bacterium]|nr:hypothetical protein [Syntrophomonadaceae bacterium]